MPPAEQLYAENLSLKERVAELETQLAWFKRKIYGHQSEKLALVDGRQTHLALPGPAPLPLPAPARTVSYERRLRWTPSVGQVGRDF